MTHAPLADLCDADKRATDDELARSAGRVYVVGYVDRRGDLKSYTPPGYQPRRRARLTNPDTAEQAAVRLVRQILQARLERRRG